MNNVSEDNSLLYELVYLCRSDVSYVSVESVSQDLRKLIGENDGSVAKFEYWGVRELAYEIKKNNRAHYALMDISIPSNRITELDRFLSLNESVIRYLITRVAEHKEGNSAIMREREKTRPDDRRTTHAHAHTPAPAPAPAPEAKRNVN